YWASAALTMHGLCAHSPGRVFEPGRDAARLSFTRIGDAGRRGLFRVVVSELTGQPVFQFELPVDARSSSPPDYTTSLVVKDRIRARPKSMGGAYELVVRVRGLGA